MTSLLNYSSVFLTTTVGSIVVADSALVMLEVYYSFILASISISLAFRYKKESCNFSLFKALDSLIAIILTSHSLGSAPITFRSIFLFLHSFSKVASLNTTQLNLSSKSLMDSPNFILILSNFCITTKSLFSLV